MAANAKCRKCDGKGKISHYAGIAGGVCFTCNGTGRITATQAARNKRADERRASSHLRRLAALTANEDIAHAKYGDDFRLAKALSRVDHPVAAQASGVMTDMRDGKPDWVIEQGIRKILPAVMVELGMAGLSIEEIEAEAQA